MASSRQSTAPKTFHGRIREQVKARLDFRAIEAATPIVLSQDARERLIIIGTTVSFR